MRDTSGKHLSRRCLAPLDSWDTTPLEVPEAAEMMPR
jgi:hypothetical protein